jgi:hypothetical protein
MEQFESELSRMRPRVPSAVFFQPIDARLAAERRSDRMLIGAMTAGAMAACFIMTVLFGQPSSGTQASPTLAVTANVPHVGSEIQAVAANTETEFWK